MDALPPGTRFGEFEILGVIGMGGFGVVYLAHDHSLERQVALKEYMPASLAVRGDGPAITVRSEALGDTYAAGLRSFVNEARLLARFDHPSLLKVYRFWEDNGTAYMVMPYLQGRTLSQTRRAMDEPPDEAWIRTLLDAVLEALDQLHREDVYHRDVAPDNIFLPRSGPPVLLDFGAARRVIVDRTQSLTAILKPSYAPIEQYADMSLMRQGPWTDLYALGAVMHFLIFGEPPAPSTSRAVQPEAQALEDRPMARVSRRFLRIVAWMLAVRPNERPQSVQALREVLQGRAEVPDARAHGVALGDPSAPAAPIEPTVREAGDYAQATVLDTRHQPTQVLPRRGAAPGAAPGTASGAAPGAAPTDGGAALRPTPPGQRPPVHVPAPSALRQTVGEPGAAAFSAAPSSSASAQAIPPRRPLLAWAIAVLALAGAGVGAAVWTGRLGGHPMGSQMGGQAGEPATSAPANAAGPAAAPSVYTGPSVGQVASVPSWGKP